MTGNKMPFKENIQKSFNSIRSNRMGKLKYFIAIVLFLIAMAIFLPKSPLHQVMVNHLQEKVEKKWGCSVAHKEVSLNVLKGTFTIKELFVKTPENSNPKWRLNIQDVVVQVKYLSLFRKNIILNSMILDTVIFKQKEKEGGHSKDVKEPAQKVKPVDKEKKPRIQTGKGKSYGAIRIKRLLIRNGHFEFDYRYRSGVENRVKADNISISKEDVFLEGKPNTFFRSILKPTNR